MSEMKIVLLFSREGLAEFLGAWKLCSTPKEFEGLSDVVFSFKQFMSLDIGAGY